MSKTKYFAIDPNGVKHTRSTSRIYTHCVVYQNSKQDAIDWVLSNERRNQDMKNAKYHLDCVANGYHENLMSFDHYRNDAARQKADVVESLERLKGAETAAEYADICKAESLAAIEATDYNVWRCAGWCGRLDLAQKLSAQYPGSQVLLAQSL